MTFALVVAQVDATQRTITAIVFGLLAVAAALALLTAWYWRVTDPKRTAAAGDSQPPRRRRRDQAPDPDPGTDDAPGDAMPASPVAKAAGKTRAKTTTVETLEAEAADPPARAGGATASELDADELKGAPTDAPVSKSSRSTTKAADVDVDTSGAAPEAGLRGIRSLARRLGTGAASDPEIDLDGAADGAALDGAAPASPPTPAAGRDRTRLMDRAKILRGGPVPDDSVIDLSPSGQARETTSPATPHSPGGTDRTELDLRNPPPEPPTSGQGDHDEGLSFDDWLALAEDD